MDHMNFLPPSLPQTRNSNVQPEMRITGPATKDRDHGERAGIAAIWEDITGKMVLKSALKFFLGSIEKLCL